MDEIFQSLRLRNIIGHFSTEFEYSSNFTTLIKIHSAVKMSVTNANEKIRLSEPKLKRFIERRILYNDWKRYTFILSFAYYRVLVAAETELWKNVLEHEVSKHAPVSPISQ